MKKLFSRLIIFILGLFGISSQLAAPQYGVPTASFDLDGMVVTDDEKQPVKNIEITLKDAYAFDKELKKWVSTTVYTNDEGFWEMSVNTAIYENYNFYHYKSITLIINDIDGIENLGFFGEDNLSVEVEQTEEDKGWYHGGFEKHGLIIVVDEAEED
jgi:putative lipoprotein (rSAM/lipoprotein system)